ncbi:MAG: type II secretion system protein GspD [Desulfuromonas sp.]|nr:MAG: type II secretion system protein GspD [Desulfuromonas sp.]
MKMRISVLLLSATFTLLLALVSTGAAQQAALDQNRNNDGQVNLDFRDVELSELILTISELTGRNFLYDDAVKGKVTIVSPDSMSIDEAYQLFQSVLYSKGFTIVPSGKVNKIVPVKGARQENLPTLTDGQRNPTEQFVTRLVRLAHLDAASVATTILAPLIASSGNIVAYPPSNTLIITDSAANIARLLRIVGELDVPTAASVLDVFTLVNADAEEVAKVCSEILDQPNAGRTRRVRREDVASTVQETASKIIPYKRTNALIVMTSAEDMLLIKDLIARMDQVPDSVRSNINLYYLENADAETLAGTLNEILTGIKSQARTAGKERPDGSPLASGPVTITADKPTNSLIINANPEDFETLKGVIEKLDIKRKQVYVEALILELSLDATQRLGVSLQGGGAVNDDGLAFGTSNLNTGPAGISDGLAGSGGVPLLLGKAIDGLLTGGFFNPVTVTGPDGQEITVPTLSVLLDISKTDSDVNILSAPRLLTSDNEEAEIIVGSNVPVITGRLTDTGSSGLAQSVTVERQDVALILRFTPQITEGDLVRLNVYQELTDIVPASSAMTASIGDPTEVGPTFTKRVLRNTVLAENGRTVVLGGLIDTNVTESVTKVPLLGDIPFLGWLFRRTSTQEEKTNLLIFINPTIVKDRSDLARVTGRNRQAASNFLTDQVIDALPENFFGDLEQGDRPAEWQDNSQDKPDSN